VHHLRFQLGGPDGFAAAFPPLPSSIFSESALIASVFIVVPVLSLALASGCLHFRAKVTPCVERVTPTDQVKLYYSILFLLFTLAMLLVVALFSPHWLDATDGSGLFDGLFFCFFDLARVCPPALADGFRWVALTTSNSSYYAIILILSHFLNRFSHFPAF
jgi:hypothetical protein